MVSTKCIASTTSTIVTSPSPLTSPFLLTAIVVTAAEDWFSPSGVLSMTLSTVMVVP